MLSLNRMATSWSEHGWTAERYAWFRRILGAYLFVHFAMLVPWGPELFSAAGAMPNPGASPLSFFPNIFAFGPPWVSVATLTAAAGASLLLLIGRGDRWAALFLWYIWAAALTRNPFIANPGIPFVGWLLLMHAAAPRDEHGRATLPPAFFAAAWLLMAAGYTYGGISKLHSASWLDGTAIRYVWESALARDTGVRLWLLEMPHWTHQVVTWGSLALELFALPIALSKRARPWLWLALTGLQLGILATIAFADLTLGMLMIHVVTFDPKWGSQARRWITSFRRP